MKIIESLEKIGESKEGHLLWLTEKERNIIFLICIGEDMYISSTADIHKLFVQDQKDIVNILHKQSILYHKPFFIYVLERGVDKGKLKVREQFYIDLINPNININIKLHGGFLPILNGTVLSHKSIKRQRWLYYTVIVGLLPFLIRFLVLFFSEKSSWSLLYNPIDAIFLGLTLNLTNINEVNQIRIRQNMNYSFEYNTERLTWWATFLIIFLSVTLGLLYFSEITQMKILDSVAVKCGTISLCIVSLAFSLSIINYTKKWN